MDDSLCQSFGKSRFPYPGGAEKNGIVFSSPAQNLDNTLKFL